MKKQISLALAVILIISLMATPAFAQTQWDYVCDFDENLDGYPIDVPVYETGDKNWISYFAAYEGQSDTPGQGIYKAVTGIGGKDENDRSLMMSNPEDTSIWGGADNYIKRQNLNNSVDPLGKLHFSFFIMIGDEMLSYKEIVLSLIQGTTKNCALKVKFDTDGYVYLNDEKTNGTYQINTPYRVDVIADQTTGDERLYIDGRFVGSINDQWITNTQTVDYFRLQYPMIEKDGKDVISTVYIDDICYKSFPSSTTIEEIETRLPAAETVKTIIFSNDFSGGMKPNDAWNTPAGFTYMYKSHSEYYPDTTTDTVGGVGHKAMDDLSFVVTTDELVNAISSYSGGDPAYDPFLHQSLKFTATETLVLSTDVYVADLNSQRWIDIRKSNSESYNAVLIEKDGRVLSNNVEVAKVYPYSWNRFTIVMTPGSDKYKLYMNGNEIGKDLTFSRVFDGYVEDIKLVTMFVGEMTEDEQRFVKPQSGITAWDNVEIYTINNDPEIAVGPSLVQVSGAVIDESEKKIYTNAAITEDMVTPVEGAEVYFIKGNGEESDNAVSGDYVCLTKDNMYAYYRVSGPEFIEYDTESESGKLIVTLNNKFGFADERPVVLVAAYDGDTLIEVTAVSEYQQNDEQTELVYTADISGMMLAERIKAFVWNSIDTMNPEYSAKLINIKK